MHILILFPGTNPSFGLHHSMAGSSVRYPQQQQNPALMPGKIKQRPNAIPIINPVTNRKIDLETPYRRFESVASGYKRNQQQTNHAIAKRGDLSQGREQATVDGHFKRGSKKIW